MFATAAAAGIALPAFEVEQLTVPPVAARAIAILLVAPASYLAQRRWVFGSGARQRRGP